MKALKNASKKAALAIFLATALKKINCHSAVVPTKAGRWPAVKMSGESVIRARRFRDLPGARVAAGAEGLRNPAMCAFRSEFGPWDTLGIPRPLQQ